MPPPLQIPLSPNLLLRPWQRGDEPSLVKYGNNRKIWINLRDSFPHPYTMRDAREWVGLARLQKPPVTQLAIATNNEAIGGIGMFLQSDVHRRTAEVGYWLGEPFWGQGIASRALTAFVDYAFANFDLVRVFAGVFDWNPASGRVLEKCGFTLESRQKNAVFKDGKVIDQLVYVLVR
ncbi:MAG: GNAT family N-acetyltransferase [SAR202 cluster bacterium]|nr:GNAT family N-acetyltransferase [SAR202 cluster bacterium]